MELDENISKIIQSVIIKTNERFIKTIMLEDESEEKSMFVLFREKYIHYLLYSALAKNQKLKNLDYSVGEEVATHLKFVVTGNYPKSGRHDIVIIDRNNNPIVGFEIFLGYDKGHYNLTSKSFIKHLDKDYMKLTKDSKLKRAFLLNYFYKSGSERETSNKTKRKERSYQSHLLKCKEKMIELNRNHRSYDSLIELSIWLVEARDDGERSLGSLKIE